MYQPIEELEIFKQFEAMSDKIWDSVVRLSNFERITLGQQLVRAADSIGANLAEGDGRFSDLDSIRFFYYARGSLGEMKYWLQRCQSRDVFPSELCEQYLYQASVLHKQLNALIKTRKENMESKHHANHPSTQQPNHPTTQSPKHPTTQSPNDPATHSPNVPSHHPLRRYES